MGLVDYSDSDLSDKEQQKLEIIKSSTFKSSKRKFQKVVDITNPGKIKITLPEVSSPEEENPQELSNKKIKLEGITRDFNAFLPAPKRNVPADNASYMETNTSKKRPLFCRELNEPSRFTTITGTQIVPPTENLDHLELQKLNMDEKKIKPLMFKPLSVSNKPSMKKKTTSRLVLSTTISNLGSSANKSNSEKLPKISLFPLATEIKERGSSPKKESYQPILYGVSNTTNVDSNDINLEDEHQENISIPRSPPSSSLTLIADSLHLSDSERRQLLGRQKGNSKSAMATNVINFNTDAEYQHNEEIRATGEKTVNNPVRAIAPGKHSLKQLIHAAQSQKDALEESFAKGKSNRAEAGSRYGW
ncbi:hypothetical protein HI914_04929 [Erysiphe necator]|nr:hypothetical protein HI914_04929 [Erysiphe necator]